MPFKLVAVEPVRRTLPVVLAMELMFAAVATSAHAEA